MAIHYGGLDVSFIAAEDLSSYQYRFVHQANDTQVDLLDSGSEYAVGILQNAPALGEIAVVRLEGVSKLRVARALALNAYIRAEYVGAADNGKGDLANTDKDIILAMSLETAGAEDDVIGVLLHGGIKGNVSSSSSSLSSSSLSSSSSSLSSSSSSSS